MISAIKRIFSYTMPSFQVLSTPTSVKSDYNIVWIDCEMTGLEVESNRLVEIACIVTDQQLKIIDEIGPIVIRQSPEVLEKMSNWCKETFKKNGLIERIKGSEINEQEAENQILEFLTRWTNPGKSPLAGNSVHMDRLFLSRYMPKIINHLHYRIIDVSSIKELIWRWYSNTKLSKVPKKKCNHLALDDIRESIEELNHYKIHFFK